MRTKEFTRRVEELGFVCEKAEEVYFIYNKEGPKYASVCHNVPNQISNMKREWDFLDKEEQEKLFDLLIEYAKTPIEDREEEKKFYLRHRWIFNKDFYMYLQKTSYDDKKMSVRVLGFSDNDDIKFSEKEIEEIKEKFDTDLKDFELVEVEE